MSLVPIVIEKSSYGERAYDIYSRLLRDNIIFIGEPIDEHVANSVVAQILFLAQEDQEKDIEIYINCPGGSVTDGLAIYDTMQYVRNPIVTVCIGEAASMAALLLAAGTPGKRFALPNSRVIIHQPSACGISGQATDIDIMSRELLRMREKSIKILAKHTKADPAKIKLDIERDFIMEPDQAKDYGIVDKIIEKIRRRE
jgi:ATP-dependent Clp protease, protease subunit